MWGTTCRASRPGIIPKSLVSGEAGSLANSLESISGVQPRRLAKHCPDKDACHQSLHDELRQSSLSCREPVLDHTRLHDTLMHLSNVFAELGHEVSSVFADRFALRAVRERGQQAVRREEHVMVEERIREVEQCESSTFV